VSALTNTDIAEIYDGLGETERAELYRYLDQPDPDEITMPELADSVSAVIDEVPEPPASTKHGEDCWKKHARCLAERVGELLPS
jgi:5,10-methenyltetrahydromethanopterin hydrogenase